MADLKEEIREYWDKVPCGTRSIGYPEGGRDFFEQIEREREEREPFIADFARFPQWRGKKVLEVGFGAATDLVRFARAGARVAGVDLTMHAVDLARKRLALNGLSADIRQSDAESLPFEDGTFDFVYSWGVLHHTENPSQAARELIRVARPGGEFCVMVYHRHSLVALQCWIINALLRGRPWRSFSDVIAQHIESRGTQAYTLDEAGRMFSDIGSMKITPVVTPYDCRLSRNRFMPPWCRKVVPPRFGWFLVIEGKKRC